MTVLRTSGFRVSVAYAMSPALRVSSFRTTVAYTEDSKVRVAQYVVKVAYLEEDAKITASSLTLTSAATYVKVPVQIASSTLVLSHSAAADLLKTVTSTLIVSQSAIASVFDRLGSTIALTQSVSVVKVYNLTATNTLVLTHPAVATTVNSAAASNTLALTQYLQKEISVTASNALILTQSPGASRQATSTLVLTQAATGIVYFVPGVASNSLLLTSTATVNIVANLALSNALILTSSISRIFITNRSVSSTLLVVDRLISLDYHLQSYVILHADGEADIVLPNPILGNTENLVSDFDAKTSMSGLQRTYVKTSDSKVLKYTFRMSEEKALALKEFVRYYQNELKLTNWKGERWMGHIISNPIDFVATGRHHVDIDLVFEGIRI